LGEWSNGIVFNVADSFDYPLENNYLSSGGSKGEALCVYAYRGVFGGVELDSALDLGRIGVVRDARLNVNQQCHYPLDYTEVAITSLQADVILKNKYIDCSTSSEPEIINNINNLIGKKFSGLTIVDIYNTSEDYSVWSEMSSEELFNNDTYSVLSNAVTLSKCVFVKSGYQKRNNTAEEYSKIFFKTSGNYFKDLNFIKRFSKKSPFGNFVNIKNKYNGYANQIESIQDNSTIQTIIFLITIIIIITSFAVCLIFFNSNLSNMKHDINIIRAIGVSRLSINLVNIVQALLFSVLFFIFAIANLGIIVDAVNKSISFSLLFIYPSVCFAILSMITIEAIIITFVTSFKSSMSKNTIKEIKKQN